MKPKNWNDLLKLYPFFEKDFMFECGNGWFELVSELCEKISKLKLGNFKVTRVKQKLGELRFYYDGVAPRAVDNWIDEAQDRSRESCENCGKPAGLSLRSGFLITTLCPDCRPKGKPKTSR